MKPIIIFASSLFSKKISGIPRYAYEVVKHLDKELEKENLDVRIVYPSDLKINVEGLNNICLVPLDRKYKKFSLQVFKHVRKENGIICSFGHDYQFNRKGIICIHDLAPLDKKEFYNFRFYKNYTLLKWNFKFNKSTIVTVSKYSRKMISKICNIPEDKIYVIPNGYEHILGIESDINIFKKLENVEIGDYFYSISSVAKHKNFKWIYEVAKRNPNKNFVIAGNINKEIWGIDGEEGKPSNVILCGYVSDEENKALLENSKAFLFPSKYEGFGIPPLEALALGKKIIISNATCLPEIFGNCAVYFDPDDYDIDLDRAINQEVESPKEILKEYTWKNASKKWIKVFKTRQND